MPVQSVGGTLPSSLCVGKVGGGRGGGRRMGGGEWGEGGGEWGERKEGRE